MEDGKWQQRLLPSDMVAEILLRLPAESLKRFRCVCKTWYDLISDSSFVMEHANRAKKSTNRLKVLLSVRPAPQSIDYEALLKHEDDGHVRSRQLKLDFSKCCPDMLMSRLYIVGSCNGLICLRGINRSQNYNDILLWDPCTVDSYVLPKLTNIFRSDLYHLRPMFCGFGYDSTTEDYKVILGDSCAVYEDGWKCSTKVRLFTLKTGLWRNYHEERRMNPIKKEYTKLAGQGCLSNGAISLDGTCVQ